MHKRFVVAAVTVLFAITGAAGLAQSPPSPAPTASPIVPGMPQASQIINDIIQAVTNRTTGAFGYNPNHAYGTVTYFHRFTMQVHLQLDKYRDVHLHQGTVINPRGATIQPGQQVDVDGHPNSDGSLEADTITLHSH